MTVLQMRELVRKAYSGNGWGHKVDNMSDIQVQAVYFSLLERGMFDKKPAPTKSNKETTFKPFIGKQITMF